MISIETIPFIKSGELFIPGGYAFLKNDKALILAKNGTTALVEKDVSDSLLKGIVPSDSRLYFLRRGILQPSISSSCSEVVTYFIIDLVKNCNFNCIYCFRDLRDKRIISIDALNDILNFIKSYCEEKKLYRIGLQMWGGEPLLALEHIEYVVGFFRKSKITAVIDVETNGSLITDETAKKLYNLGIHIGVSIDGIPHLQNKQRPFVNGEPTAIQVERGIRTLQKYYKDSIGGITVVTKFNYKFIKEILNYYIYHLRLRSLKFNIVRDNSNASIEDLSLNVEEVTRFANELCDLLYAFRCMGISFSEGNIDVRLRNLLYQCKDNLCLSQGCRGGRSIISFNQDGCIFPCEMTDFAEEQIGSIYSGNSLDEMITGAIQKNKFFIPKESKICSSCPWWCYCRGGCTSRIRYTGLVGKPDNCECALNRAIYPRIVEGILDGTIGE